MDIPAFFTSRSDDRLSVSCGRFTSTKTEHWGPAVPFNEAAGAGIIREERSPAVVVDVDSLESKAFNEGVMKIMKVRGADLWFMTYIETVDDVFDAFNSGADMLLAPYHAVESDYELEDIHSVSDSFIPVVFTHNGKGVMRNGRLGEVPDILESLADLGFYRTCVVDGEETIPDCIWESLEDDYPSCIPIVDRATVCNNRFRNRIIPFRPR